MLTQNSNYIAPLKSCYAHLERDSTTWSFGKLNKLSNKLETLRPNDKLKYL